MLKKCFSYYNNFSYARFFLFLFSVYLYNHAMTVLLLVGVQQKLKAQRGQHYQRDPLFQHLKLPLVHAQNMTLSLSKKRFSNPLDLHLLPKKSAEVNGTQLKVTQLKALQSHLYPLVQKIIVRL